MLLKLFEIFISLLIINVSEGVRLNIAGSSFTKNKYSDSHVILAFNNTGPLMCVSDCLLYKECNAVNFNRNKLECELLAVSYPGDSITSMDSSYYTEIGGWKKDKDECTPNPCDVREQCILAMYNNHICLEFDAPCDVSPCQNDGVCRNKVNDYRCICPKGYSGDHCEQTPCTNVNCNFGSCVIDGSTWRCQCPTGHHGTYCEQYPRDCEDFIENESKSGIYQIYPSDTRGFETYCDMETEGGGWLVFQKRQDGSVDFFRNWTDYKNGFGDVTGEFWLGNSKIHEITTKDEYELYILMEDLEGEQRYARYKTFYIGDIQSKFALEIGGYSGNAGNSLDTTNHKSQPFSTLDRDSSSNCPKLFKGGWWYGNCHHSNLNGLYLNGPHKSYADGIEWYHWKGHYYSLKKTQMMIRRRR